MKERSKFLIYLGSLSLLMAGMLVLNSCSKADGEYTGSEFMPDMVHDVAYEANVYSDYYLITWDEESSVSRWDLSQPRKPVEGTVPRGYAGMHYANSAGEADSMKTHLDGGATKQGIAIPWNGHVPFHYEDTEEERQKAMKDIQRNPFPITEEGLTKGGELYNIYCGICHGSNLAGDGYIVRDDGGKYPAQPAIMNTEEFINASAGRYYFAIMYGKNMMGRYAGKLSYEERWQVIHYIRSLQAKEVDATYDSEKNTLNDEAIPESKWNKQIAGGGMDRNNGKNTSEEMKDSLK